MFNLNQIPQGLPIDQAGVPLIWLTGYEEVRDAFKQPGLLQTSYDGAKTTIFADVLITLDGAPHGHRRRAEATLFRPDIVAHLESTVVPAAAAHLIGALKVASEADLVDISRLVNTGMAARIVGLEGAETIEELEDLSELMAKLHEGVVIEWSTRPHADVLAEVAVARDAYRERFFGPSLRRREARLQGGGSPRAGATDLIELLLVHQQEHAMDAEKILRESIHYLAASAHTTATVVVHACHEIWGWISAHPEDAGKLADPVFMQACMNEAMRLWPPSGWHFRMAADDLQLASGRAIRKGERLGLNLIRANRDPAVFGADADCFDPRRQVPKRVPSSGLAFGDGEHICIGKRLAAGAQASVGANGILAAIGIALFAAGVRPHPTQAPKVHAGTARHQYLTYPVVFT